MAFINKTGVISGANPAIFPAGPEVVAQRASFAAQTADLLADKVGAFLVLPAGCVPVGIYLDADAALAGDVGVLDNAETAISTAVADGSGPWLLALAANGTEFSFSKAMSRVLPSGVDRKIGIKVTTPGPAGQVGMTMQYRAA
jgi:hypothetical protein